MVKVPDKTYLVIVAVAGHGMSMDGKQVLLVNQFSKRLTFYLTWGVEAELRTQAGKFSNAYFVGIFACCREIHSTKKHSGCFGGSEMQAHVHFDTKAYDAFLEQGTELTPARAEALKRLQKTLIEKLKNFESIEKDKIEIFCK